MCSLMRGLFKLKLKRNVSHQFRNWFQNIQLYNDSYNLPSDRVQSWWGRSGWSWRAIAQRETSNSALCSCAQVELDQYTRAVPSACSLYVILYLWQFKAGIFEPFLNSVHTSKWHCRTFFGKISRGQPVTSPLFVYDVEKQLPVWQFLLVNPGLHLQR